MTGNKYKSDEILEASRQHHDLTRDPDLMTIAEGMSEWEPWKSMVGQDGSHTQQFNESLRNIRDMIDNAEDTSVWSVNLGILGLTPQIPSVVRATNSEDDDHRVGFQIATPKGWSSKMNQHLAFEVRRAMENAVQRVLDEYGTNG